MEMNIEKISSNEEYKNMKQHIVKHCDKENVVPKIKKRKVDETKELEQSLVQMSQRICTYMEKKTLTTDDAFMEFIKAQLNDIPEKEKHIRRKLIMDALTTELK